MVMTGITSNAATVARGRKPHVEVGLADRAVVTGAKTARVVTKAQLLELGFSHRAVVHRMLRGRLHPVQRGVTRSYVQS
jgi:hypothetical protein